MGDHQAPPPRAAGVGKRVRVVTVTRPFETMEHHDDRRLFVGTRFGKRRTRRQQIIYVNEVFIRRGPALTPPMRHQCSELSR